MAGAWNRVPVTPVGVSAGTAYWLALLGPAGGGIVRFRSHCCYTNAGTPLAVSAQTSLVTLPSSWTTGAVYRDGPMSIYGSNG